MKQTIRFLLRQLVREGLKGLAAAALALVLALLVGILADVQRRQTSDLEDVLDNFEVLIVVSNAFNGDTDGLFVDEYLVRHFADHSYIRWLPNNLENDKPLARYVKDVVLKRPLEILEVPGLAGARIGELIGITGAQADERLDPHYGRYIEFFDGFDDSVFQTRENVCAVNEEILMALDPADPVLSLTVRSYTEGYMDFPPPGDVGVWIELDRELIEAELSVVGVVHGGLADIYCPYWLAEDMGKESDGWLGYSTIMRALMADNRLVDDFMVDVNSKYSSPWDSEPDRLLALTIYDNEFNSIVKKQRDNIAFVEIVAVFLYCSCSLTSLLAGYLLTRRHRLDVAVMRVIGIGKRDIFISLIAEQAALFVIGAAAGWLLGFALFGAFTPVLPLIFALMYILGSLLCCVSAMDRNIHRLLVQKEL